MSTAKEALDFIQSQITKQLDKLDYDLEQIRKTTHKNAGSLCALPAILTQNDDLQGKITELTLKIGAVDSGLAAKITALDANLVINNKTCEAFLGHLQQNSIKYNNHEIVLTKQATYLKILGIVITMVGGSLISTYVKSFPNAQAAQHKQKR